MLVAKALFEALRSPILGQTSTSIINNDWRSVLPHAIKESLIQLRCLNSVERMAFEALVKLGRGSKGIVTFGRKALV